MKVLNFGSLNVDYVYDVKDFVVSGETILSGGMEKFSGGKGLNQSVAAAKAGLNVFHAGVIGNDGDILLDTLIKNGVKVKYIEKKDVAGGHTIIQVDAKGQNCIIVFGGTNQSISKEFIDSVFENFRENDVLLLQNEINNLDYVIKSAHKEKMTVFLNPSPINAAIKTLPLDLIDFFVVNEIEGGAIAGVEDCDEIIDKMIQLYPNSRILLTLGKEGSIYYDKKSLYKQKAFLAEAVDTTAAGDTFLGYFVYGYTKNMPPQEILELAAKASSITVSRKGAANSIPCLEEVLQKKSK